MSYFNNFKDYSKSPFNVLNLTDKQIAKYFDIAERKTYPGRLIHCFVPYGLEESYDPNFVRDSTVRFVSSFLINNMFKNKTTTTHKPNLKKTNKTKKTVSFCELTINKNHIATKALDEISKLLA